VGESIRKLRPPSCSADAGKTAGVNVLPSKQFLLDVLRQAFDQLPDAASVRVETPAPGVNARAWFAAQDAPVRSYWRSRDGAFEAATVGAADTVGSPPAGRPDFSTVFSKIRAKLSCAHPAMRYYGGWAFDSAGPADSAWGEFGTYRFVLPRFEVNIRHGSAIFACNACRTDAGTAGLAAVADEFDQLSAAVSCGVDSRVPALTRRQDVPMRRDWERLVERALGAIQEGEFEKAVLARQVTGVFSALPDVSALLDRLALRNNHNTYLFAIQPARGVAFLGATPERLYKKLGNYIKTEALAGTRPRGVSAAADETLSRDLLHNDKELREHGIVADRLRGVLDRMCCEVRADKALSLIRLHRCQHLVRRYEGVLEDGLSDADVLAALHPTPAVGGHPDGPALQWLGENEAFNRGWYAGPVGWIGHDASEFAMGIRSGLVSGRNLTLYSGAGIVAGSAPGAEWDETESKLAAFLDVLTENEQKTQ